MIKIDLPNIKMQPGKILVEIFGQNETLNAGDIKLHVNVGKAYGTSDMTATGDGEHMERSGKVAAKCNRVEPTQKYNYYTDIDLEIGDEVWFPSSAYAKATRNLGVFTYKERQFIIIDYHLLYMKQNDHGSEMINGYMLCKSVEKCVSNLVVAPKDVYYEDVFLLAKRGKPIEYINRYYDDPSIKEGDYILTRFKHYPKLEEMGHKYYSDETYYVIQPKEIVAIVKSFK